MPIVGQPYVRPKQPNAIMSEATIHYVDADDVLRMRIAREWDEVAARHMHIADGFSIVAMLGEKPIGLISLVWRTLPPPLLETYEGYIDIIEVHKDFRRKGIARQLIEMSMERAGEHGAYQVRAWSSEDKIEAIPMWKSLGFSLCPAITYPKGQEVRGYFVAKILQEQASDWHRSSGSFPKPKAAQPLIRADRLRRGHARAFSLIGAIIQVSPCANTAAAQMVTVNEIASGLAGEPLLPKVKL